MLPSVQLILVTSNFSQTLIASPLRSLPAVSGYGLVRGQQPATPMPVVFVRGRTVLADGAHITCWPTAVVLHAWPVGSRLPTLGTSLLTTSFTEVPMQCVEVLTLPVRLRFTTTLTRLWNRCEGERTLSTSPMLVTVPPMLLRTVPLTCLTSFTTLSMTFLMTPCLTDIIWFGTEVSAPMTPSKNRCLVPSVFRFTRLVKVLMPDTMLYRQVVTCLGSRETNRTVPCTKSSLVRVVPDVTRFV